MTIQVGDTVRAVPVDPDPSYWVHSEGYLWLVTWVAESSTPDPDAHELYSFSFSYFVEFQYLATGRRQRWGICPCDVHPNRWIVRATKFYLEKADAT
jgi:hypothetical protein